ncbi:class I SAM-dependent methyltransferase [Patescibacteria group bacterium]|nr:class I SAM-dependent methyltransferase [Patescibacteria group bacterium]
MHKNHQKLESKEAILKYWKKVVKSHSPAIRSWIKKENLYLQKNIKKDSIVLDVGCGIGRNIKAIANIAKKIIGIDNNKRLFKEIKKSLSKFKNVKVFLEEAQRLHFKNNTFDYAICMGNTFGDFGEDKLKILKEMQRVTKKGGRIIISVYSEKALPIRLKEYKKAGMKLEKTSKDGTVVTEEGIITEQFSKRKLQKIFNKAGLNIKIIKLSSISYLCEAIKKG